MAQSVRRLVGDTRRGLLPGSAASAASVAVCTAAISGLRETAPVLSLGVLRERTEPGAGYRSAA